MRLTGKFALVATVIAALSGPILATKLFTSITKGSKNTEVMFDDYTVTIDNADDFLADVLAGKAGTHTITNVGADFITAQEYKVRLPTGGFAKITAATKDADPAKTQKLTIAPEAGVAESTKTKAILLSDVEYPSTTEFSIKEPLQGSFSKVKLTLDQIKRMKAILNTGGVASYDVAVNDVTLATTVDATTKKATKEDPLGGTAAFDGCYTLDKHSAKICIYREANKVAQVSVSAKVTTNPPSNDIVAQIKLAAPYFVVFIIFLVAPIGVSQIHAAIDAQGYQAGKDASFLPSFYKNLMADTEFAQEDPYSLTGEDDDNTGEIRVDPNTGRPIRTKKAGGANASAADGSDDVTGEETSAYGVSIMAAALMVPFLL